MVLSSRCAKPGGTPSTPCRPKTSFQECQRAWAAVAALRRRCRWPARRPGAGARHHWFGTSAVPATAPARRQWLASRAGVAERYPYVLQGSPAAARRPCPCAPANAERRRERRQAGTPPCCAPRIPASLKHLRDLAAACSGGPEASAGPFSIPRRGSAFRAEALLGRPRAPARGWRGRCSVFY